MTITKFNPPFTNSNIEDFFNFESNQKEKLSKIRKYIKSKYPQLAEGLKYHVPFYSFQKKPLFFLHYLKGKKMSQYSSEISFIRGDKMYDNLKWFQKKNSKIKAILLPNNLTSSFLEDLSNNYIDQSFSLV